MLLPEEYLVLIGSVVIGFNNVDNLLTAILVELTGNDFNKILDNIPFVNMSFGVKKPLLDLLIKQRQNPTKGSLIDTYQTTLRLKLDEVVSQRNDIAHSVWTYEKGVVTRRRFIAKRRIEIEAAVVTVEELQELVTEIEECRIRLATLALYLKESKSAPQEGQK